MQIRNKFDKYVADDELYEIIQEATDKYKDILEKQYKGYFFHWGVSY